MPAIGNTIQVVESTISLITVAASVVAFLWYRYSYKTITLSCGTFRIRRKFFNSVDMTTIVSNLFYDGGQVEGKVRQEIFKITGATGERISVTTKLESSDTSARAKSSSASKTKRHRRPRNAKTTQKNMVTNAETKQ